MPIIDGYFIFILFFKYLKLVGYSILIMKNTCNQKFFEKSKELPNIGLNNKNKQT
jgi:hypothetical protein